MLISWLQTAGLENGLFELWGRRRHTLLILLVKFTYFYTQWRIIHKNMRKQDLYRDVRVRGLHYNQAPPAVSQFSALLKGNLAEPRRWTGTSRANGPCRTDLCGQDLKQSLSQVPVDWATATKYIALHLYRHISKIWISWKSSTFFVSHFRKWKPNNISIHYT